jgi:hypothetical protein
MYFINPNPCVITSPPGETFGLVFENAALERKA